MKPLDISVYSYLKGQCHEIVELCFFMILTALVVMIKFSRNWFRFRGEIFICKKLLDVINTMESDMFAAMTSG